jgi:hypothetical protein
VATSDAADEPTNDVDEAAPDWRAFVPTDTADHLATMDRAARQSGCGVPWQLLAAIARVESDFGRNMATSSAGAIGYGQFLPSSWRAFGSEGNAYDYRDALPAIALYLCQSGLARDPRAALFAYNHADWYVDLVLDLAVRYDRMAPGAPIPDVLDVGPTDQAPRAAMRYAPGRDVQLQTRARVSDDGVRWVGVPWRGRSAGQPIAPEALQTTALTMLRVAAGMSGNTPLIAEAADAPSLSAFANAAWSGGLLGLPSESGQWSVDELRRQVQMGHPVVAIVDSTRLPGHPVDDASGDQPLVLIGSTPDGLIYNDPTFSSSLGYGLEINNTDFAAIWSGASTPLQALAFVPRPGPAARQAHLRTTDAPEPIARAPAAPASLATPAEAAAQAPIAASTPTPPAEPDPSPVATAVAAAATPTVAGQPSSADDSWVGLLVCGALVGAFAVVRRLSARPLP